MCRCMYIIIYHTQFTSISVEFTYITCKALGIKRLIELASKDLRMKEILLSVMKLY